MPRSMLDMIGCVSGQTLVQMCVRDSIERSSQTAANATGMRVVISNGVIGRLAFGYLVDDV